MTGILPASLGNLSQLQSLVIFQNPIAGTLPASLGNLSQLTSLNIEYTQINGEIPASLGNLPRLTSLFLAQNQLTGIIPASLGKLTQLENLYLFGNSLTKCIPAELASLCGKDVLITSGAKPDSYFTTFCSNGTGTCSTTPTTGNLTLTQPTYDCATGAFKFNTTGGNGSPITYFAPGITGPTTNPNQFVDAGLRQAADAKPISLSATQSGVTVTYVFDLRATCPIGPNPPVQTNPDRAALVELYNATNGPGWTRKTNWLQGDSPCNWFGVKCDGTGRVTELSLSGNNLNGTLPASFGNLSQLTYLNLGQNQLSGSIPVTLGNLSQLKSFLLPNNQLTGSIPASLGNLSQLTYLTLQVNRLTGPIPASLGNLANVQFLLLDSNQLSGTIPASLGNLSQVLYLQLSGNRLSGNIPNELSNLPKLIGLSLLSNQLSGSIPANFGNLSQLTSLQLQDNQLSGPIPPSLGNLTQLQSLSLFNNQLSGSIPVDLGRLTRLLNMSLSNNQLSGCFPNELASLCGKSVSMSNNPGLPGGGNFDNFCSTGTGSCSPPSSSSLTLTQPTYNCTTGAFTFNTTGGNGSTITYFAPGITGPTTNPNQFVDAGLRQAADAKPISLSATQSGVTATYVFDLRATCPIGPNPPVQTNNDRAILVDLYNATKGPIWVNKTNWLQGDSPCNWFGVSCNENGRVIKLSLGSNNLTGTLPASLGNLSQLESLILRRNELNGSIPANLGSLSSLIDLYLNNNQLSGNLPASLGNLSKVAYFQLEANKLTGSIPANLGNLSQVQSLGLNDNQLTGEIPAELGNLKNLTGLNLNDNQLSGPIPASLGNLSKVLVLYLSVNKLSGSIPASLGSLSQIQYINFSGNRLTGSIPASLGNLSQIKSLLLINNSLSGCFPAELASLCGKDVLLLGNLGLPGGGDFASFCINRTGACTGTPTPGNLALTAPTYDCTTGAFTFNTTGGDGSTITYFAPGITGPTTNPNQFVDAGLRQAADAQPLTLSATQSGVTVTYRFDLRATCPIGTNPPVQSNPDRAILVDLYNSTNGPGWRLNNNWLQGDSPCNWFGVKCDVTGRVTELSLSGNNLNGTLPASLGNLSQLTYLSLGQNQISGSIPATLGNLSQLKSLLLFTNQLSGPIPASLGNLSQLTYLTLQTNRLTGIVPVSLGNLANVQYLLLDNNLLSGPIPVSLSNLSQALYLQLSNNQLSGNIPGELSNLPKLVSLILFGNQLSGSIPTGLGNLTQLEALQLQRNQLSGPIPATLGNLTQLRFLFLDNNQLSGSIPASLGRLTQLVNISLNTNQLSGCFPTELTSLCGKSVLMTGNPGLPGGGDFASFCSNRTGACPVTPTTGLSLTQPTYNCATGAFKFNTIGGNGTPIEYQAPGITGWTTNPNQFVDKESRTANDVQPFMLMARQSGTVATYTWNLKQACGRARVATEEVGTTLSLQVLGNPAREQVRVLITGAEGQPVQLRLTDLQGRLLESRTVEQAGASEEQRFQLDQAGPHLLLLQATKQQQVRTVKIVRQ